MHGFLRACRYLIGLSQASIPNRPQSTQLLQQMGAHIICTYRWTFSLSNLHTGFVMPSSCISPANKSTCQPLSCPPLTSLSKVEHSNATPSNNRSRPAKSNLLPESYSPAKSILLSTQTHQQHRFHQYGTVRVPSKSKSNSKIWPAG